MSFDPVFFFFFIIGLTAICGKQIKIIQSDANYDNVKFNEWVDDILDELGTFLMMAGVRMKTHCVTPFFTKTLALVKLAYGLRTGMTEKDICGGLEIVVVSPGTPFQEKWMMMDDHHHVNADHPTGVADQSRVDFVVGTTAIGLQRKVLERVDGERFEYRMEMELKPKVMLARALKF